MKIPEKEKNNKLASVFTDLGCCSLKKKHAKINLKLVQVVYICDFNRLDEGNSSEIGIFY